MVAQDKINPGNSNVVYVGTYGFGIYKSTDGDAVWIAINNGLFHLHIQTAAIDPNNSIILYADTGKGVFEIMFSACTKSGYVPKVTVKPGAQNSTIYLRTSSLASSYKRFTTTDTKLIKAAVKSLPGRTYVEIKGDADCTTATSGGAAQQVIVAP